MILSGFVSCTAFSTTASFYDWKVYVGIEYGLIEGDANSPAGKLWAVNILLNKLHGTDA